MKAHTGHSDAGRGREEAGRTARRLKGSTLVAVVAIVSAVLLIGVAIFVLGHSEGDIVEFSVDDTRAFYVAEGGLERARAWLGDFHTDDPTGDPLGKIFEDQMLGGGRYTVEVVEDVSGGSWLGAYKVVSTGQKDPAVRQVRSIMMAETFARYQVFVERGGWVWFRTGERFEGPVHVNHSLQIDGDPWFGGPVTAGGGLTEKSGSNPTFVQGYSLGVDNIPLPADSYPTDTILPAAVAGGFRMPDLSGPKAKYQIVLGQSSPGTMDYKSYELVGGSYAWSGWTTVDLTLLNGAVYCPTDLRLNGTLDGQVTIGVEGDIEIIDDLLYYGVTPGDTPPLDCDDALGLIANGDVRIMYVPPNENDILFYAVAMALEKNIEAEDYQHHPPRGEIDIFGGIIADYSIHLGQYDSDNNILSGYVRDYHWDARMVTMPPPFFPLTGRYFVYSWEEVVPPEV